MTSSRTGIQLVRNVAMIVLLRRTVCPVEFRETVKFARLHAGLTPISCCVKLLQGSKFALDFSDPVFGDDVPGRGADREVW